MRHTIAICAFLLAQGLGIGGPAFAQTVSPGQERQVRNFLYLAIKARVLAARNMRTEGLGADELEAIIRRGGHPYTRQWAFKAFAACIRWPTRPGERIDIRGVYTVFESMNAGGIAVAECRSRYRAQGCDCVLVDENDRNMLRVPRRVIPLLLRRTTPRPNRPRRRRGQLLHRRGSSYGR